MCTCRGPVRYCNLYHGFWNHIQFVSGLYQMDGLNNLKLLHVKRRYLRILLITKNAVWYTISTISKVCSKRNNIFGIYIYVTHFFTIYHYFLIHFQPMFHFNTPWKHQKTGAFLIIYSFQLTESISRKLLTLHIFRFLHVFYTRQPFYFFFN